MEYCNKFFYGFRIEFFKLSAKNQERIVELAKLSRSQHIHFLPPCQIEILDNAENKTVIWLLSNNSELPDRDIKVYNNPQKKDVKKIIHKYKHLDFNSVWKYYNREQPHILILTKEGRIELHYDYNPRFWGYAFYNVLMESLVGIEEWEMFRDGTKGLKEILDKTRALVRQNIIDKWKTVLTYTTANEKGKALEELVALLVTTIKGFIPSLGVRTQTEEIDISIRNESKDSFWSKFTPFLLVECKNWSTNCGKDEIVLFREKLTNRVGYSKVGFLISMNGFRDTITKEMLRGSKGEYLVVPIDGNNLEDLVFSKDKSDLLKKYVEKSIFT